MGHQHTVSVLIGDVEVTKGSGVRVAAIMTGTTRVTPAGGERPTTASVGELVFVELPINCTVIGVPGRTTDDAIRILSLAHEIGAHWRDQEGVNGALLDELAKLTAP